MKKMIFLILLTALTFSFAQNNAAAIKLGFFSPSAVDGTGFIIGYEGGKHIDEALDVCWSVDWFSKEWEDKDAEKNTETNIPGLEGDTYKEISNTSINDIPIMFSITAKFPINNKTKWFLTGGLGAEILLASYHSYDNTIEGEETDKITDKYKVAVDWNWRAGAGVLYNLGQRSELFGECTFHYSIPSYTFEENGVEFKREYDMKGILGRVGVRYYF